DLSDGVAGRRGDGGGRRVGGIRRAGGSAHRATPRRNWPPRRIGRQRADGRVSRRGCRPRCARCAAAGGASARRRDRDSRRAILSLDAQASHVIEFTDVRVRYPRQPREALQGVSLSAPRAQITAVVGPNGSGKSTLVRTLLRRVDVTAGAVTL